MTSTRTSLRFSVAALLAVALVGAVACSSKKPQPQPTAPPQAAPVDSSPKTDVDVTPKQDYTPPKTEQPEVEALPSDLQAIAAKYLKDVFFDFDRYELKEEFREALAANADFLKKHGTVKIRIEGHCDERGTREYNLSLGEKRANAAKDYLMALGIAEERIEVISYGKERPFDPGHDEDAWEKNRRGHFVVTAK